MSQLDLKLLGGRLRAVDRQILTLVKKRMDLARQVGAKKLTTKEPIFRAVIEDQRIADIRSFAEEIGINSHFAAGLLYDLIGESCKQQMIQLQNGDSSLIQPTDPDERYAWLKANLLRLAEEVMQMNHDDRISRYPATAEYVGFEKRFVLEEVTKLADKGVAIDLACGKGFIAQSLIASFEQVYGFDLSPHMIKVACELETRAHFKQTDLDLGIPMPDSTVCLVVMGLGSASNVKSAKNLMGEVSRVLRPGGRFILSFHNAKALMYETSFVPWENGWAAFVDVDEECLNVNVGGNTYKIHAKPYSSEEIQQFTPPSLHIEFQKSYPVISSVVPKVLLEQTGVRQKISEIDNTLVDSNQGAYLLISGKKE